MRVVGSQNRSGVELDPASALRRGRALDAMLSQFAPPYPRGVYRGTQRYFARLEAERQAQVARLLNTP